MAVTLYVPPRLVLTSLHWRLVYSPLPSEIPDLPLQTPFSSRPCCYLQTSFCWYFASRIIADSRRSSSMSNYFIINSEFLTGLNPETWALHKFTSTSITTSAPYVRENRVSPVDLLGVVQYAHRTLGNSSIHPPLAPSNLLFNLFTIALLMASAWHCSVGMLGWNTDLWCWGCHKTHEKPYYQTATHYLTLRISVLQILSLYSSTQTSLHPHLKCSPMPLLPPLWWSNPWPLGQTFDFLLLGGMDQQCLAPTVQRAKAY